MLKRMASKKRKKLDENIKCESRDGRGMIQGIQDSEGGHLEVRWRRALAKSNVYHNRKKFQVSEVSSVENVDDLGTKHLACERLEKLLHKKGDYLQDMLERRGLEASLLMQAGTTRGEELCSPATVMCEEKNFQENTGHHLIIQMSRVLYTVEMTSIIDLVIKMEKGGEQQHPGMVNDL